MYRLPPSGFSWTRGHARVYAGRRALKRLLYLHYLTIILPLLLHVPFAHPDTTFLLLAIPYDCWWRLGWLGELFKCFEARLSSVPTEANRRVCQEIRRTKVRQSAT